ncbi:MAG: hypothetical protein HOV80_17195 [Polyangiaceae bacterium]|nr:hypothetical protein [Polyangiaceae bacterium]
MRSLAWIALMGVCGSISCGARSSLRDLLVGDEDDPSGGGGHGATTTSTTSLTTTGGEGGGIPMGECGVVELTDYALTPLVLDGASISTVEMTKATGSSTMVCAAGRIQEQVTSAPYGGLCFDAFGAWPTALDQPTPLIGASVGQLRLAPGLPDGIAIVTGADGDVAAPVAKYNPAWLPGRPPQWSEFPFGGEIVPTFITPAGDTHIAGLALGDTFETWLSVTSLVSIPADFVGAACAQGPLVAGGIYDDDRVIVAAASGASVGGCLVEPIMEARRFQVVSWPFDGPPNVFLDEDWPSTIDDVKIADAGSSFWVAARVANDVSVIRLSKAGVVEVPLTHVGITAGPMSIAMRGADLLVATIDWTDPDLAADVIVSKISPDGTVGSFGGFDTNEAMWFNDLALVVSDDQLHAVVGYHTGPGQLAARRFDCVTE